MLALNGALYKDEVVGFTNMPFSVEVRTIVLENRDEDESS